MAGELYAAEARPVAPAVSGGGKLTLFLLALVIVVIAEAIGNVSIPVGSGKIVLLPLLRHAVGQNDDIQGPVGILIAIRGD